MAASASIMSGLGQALSVFSRRKLASACLLSALSSTAFAAAILLRNSGQSALATIAGPGEAALFDLCAACNALQQEAAAFWQGATRIADEGARKLALKHIADQQAPLLEQLCQFHPTTLQGHAARARTLLLWDKDPRWTRPAGLDEEITVAVVRNLARSA